MKELLQDTGFITVLLIIAFVCGLALGAGLSYHDGYQKGFEKALPLTYATQNK
jgi:hypothetical protein